MAPHSNLPSIQHKVGRLITLIAVLGVVASAFFTWMVLDSEVDVLMDHGLRQSALALRATVAPLAVNPDAPAVIPNDDGYAEFYVWQIIALPSGHVRVRSQAAPASALLSAPVLEPVRVRDGSWRAITFDLPNDPTHFLVVAQSLGRQRGSVQHAVLLVLAITAFVGLLMVTVIRQAIRRGLTPLTSLAKVVERYDPMVPDTAPRSSQWAELAPMATSITDLGQRLARRIVSERAINAHAAHALRTPLAGIDAQLAVAQKIAPAELRPWLSRARAAAHRLIRVMQSLLTMHRTGSDVRRQSVRLSELVALWSSDEVKVEIRGLREVMADPDLLAAVLSNLLDNAREHGAKDVRIRTQLSDLGWYRLQVIDNGRGCPTHVHEQLRAAFGRHDYHLKAGSSGLGLILANLVMNAHGGLVRLPYTARGFCVELAWPSANPQRSHD